MVKARFLGTVAFAAAVGCITSPSATENYQFACGQNDTCPSGQTCVSGLCYPEYDGGGGGPDGGDGGVNSNDGGSDGGPGGATDGGDGGAVQAPDGGDAGMVVMRHVCPMSKAFGSALAFSCGDSDVSCYGVALDPFGVDAGDNLIISADEGSVILQNRKNNFGSPMALPSAASDIGDGIAVGDLDGDGIPEIALGSGTQNGTNGDSLDLVWIWKGLSDGGFLPPVAVAAGPVNNDCLSFDPTRVWIVSAKAGQLGMVLYLDDEDDGAQFGIIRPLGGNTYGTGTLFSVPNNNLGAVAAGDVNGDGFVDVVATDAESQVYVLLADGGGGFEPPVPYGTGSVPEGVALADLDGKNGLDIVTANDGDNTVSVLFNNGDGTFGAHVSFPTNIGDAGIGPDTVLVADFNGDGYPDIVTADAALYATLPGGFYGAGISVLQGMPDAGFGPPLLLLQDYYTPFFMAAGQLTRDAPPGLVVSSWTNSSANEVEVFFNGCVDGGG